MKKMNLKQWIVILLSLPLFFYACDDDEKAKPGAYENGVFIVNEGNMGSGDGSVSFYSYKSDSVFNNIFEGVNGRVLGDVVQSISLHENNAYIVANASNKVEVVNATTFEETGVIGDINGPRYFLGIDKNKAYVSQWGDNGAVKVVNLSTLTVVKTISTGAGSEKMILHNNQVYVANSGGLINNNTVSVIDPTTDEVIKTITLNGDSPRDFVVDANENIWVLCAGYQDYSNWPDIGHTASKLITIDPTSNEVISSIIIGETVHPTHLEVNNTGDQLFYGGGYGFNGIYKMNITDTDIPSTPLINKGFYGFNINPETGNIFALETALDYVSNGKLYRYNTSGELLGEYKVGVGPNGAAFKK